MALCLCLILSKAQHAAGIANGTPQGIEGHISDPPKVLASDTATNIALEEDEDVLALEIQGTGITLEDDEDDTGGHMDEVVKAAIPSGSRKYVSCYLNPCNDFLMLPVVQNPRSSGDREE